MVSPLKRPIRAAEWRHSDGASSETGPADSNRVASREIPRITPIVVPLADFAIRPGGPLLALVCSRIIGDMGKPGANNIRPAKVKLGPLTQHLARASQWDDIYPASQGWANECERLLAFADAHGQLQRFWPRLTAKKQQRDEALNEIRVAHFLSGAGYPILGWEVIDAPPSNVEFEIGLGTGSTAFVEVKSPGWEGELGYAERKAGRKKLEKYVGPEARPADPIGVIRRTAEKARPKFSGSRPSLLVIADDCFVNLGEWGWGPLKVALTSKTIGYGDGLFHQIRFSVLGGVSLFRVSGVNQRDVKYSSLCLANPNALRSATLPGELVSRLSTVPVEPAPHIVQPGTLVGF